MLVDRKSVEDHIYGRTGVATANFLNNPERFRSKNTKSEFNIDKASQLLEDAGWKKGADASIEKLAAQALVTTAPQKRTTLYQSIQKQLNQRGPYFPLIQPTQVFVATTDLKNALFNAVYQIDVTRTAPK